MEYKANILLVDDDEMILKMSSQLLKKAGFRVQTASNTIGAGYLLKDFDPDLVVLDINLPGSFSGDHACDAFRALKPDLKIVFFSGIEAAELDQLGRNNKADACVNKGGRMSELIETIKGLLHIS